MSVDGGLRVLFRENLRANFQWTTVETGAVTLGVPDSEFCYRNPALPVSVQYAGVQGWIEYKWTETNAVGLRSEQIGWHEHRGRVGGRIYIGVRKRHNGGPRKGPAVDELWLLDGRNASAVKTFGLNPKMSYFLGKWSGGPEQWDWQEVKAILSR
jgi:hypothetical protein